MKGKRQVDRESLANGQSDLAEVTISRRLLPAVDGTKCYLHIPRLFPNDRLVKFFVFILKIA
jgi:hypothetical protein